MAKLDTEIHVVVTAMPWTEPQSHAKAFAQWMRHNARSLGRTPFKETNMSFRDLTPRQRARKQLVETLLKSNTDASMARLIDDAQDLERYIFGEVEEVGDQEAPGQKPQAPLSERLLSRSKGYRAMHPVELSADDVACLVEEIRALEEK